ncbi:MAG: sugar ABC transporter ATP-binding protein, partial [Lachnoclostridium sp.]|nr:sugar ABC transporter ATP-binding protein [Lachnoclostridium sp.]
MGTEKMKTDNNLLSMKGIDISFPGVHALNHVDFTLRSGEIHAVMGENGAGKSTLIKVLTGVYHMDEGSIFMDNNPIVISSPQDTQKYGINTVYQEINLCANLTVAENLYLGLEPRTFGTINWKKMNHDAAELLEKLNIAAHPTMQLDNYSIAIQQMIAIARAVSIHCKVLILDEPTSSLDADEVEKLFNLMRQLKNQGVSIIFITHFLEQVYAVCDRITVLRNGELVGEYETEKLPRLALVGKMMGKELDDLANLTIEKETLTETGKEEAFLEANDLSSGLSKIAPFNIKINKGEVIGFSGLLGSGRSERVRSIYGADQAVPG